MVDEVVGVVGVVGVVAAVRTVVDVGIGIVVGVVVDVAAVRIANTSTVAAASLSSPPPAAIERDDSSSLGVRIFDDDDVYSTSKGSNTNLVFGTSLSVVLV